jgi:uncharacterized membrane protein
MPREMRPRAPASAEPFIRYWRIYGGWRALVTSPYLLVALVLTGICYPYWSKPGTASADLAMTVIPSIMAFSLGGMAIILAFSGGRFFNLIRQDGEEKSLFMTVIANFFHFLTIQTLALISALIVLAFPLDKAPSGIAFFFLAYSVTSAVASAAALFNVSRLYNVVGDDNNTEQ